MAAQRIATVHALQAVHAVNTHDARAQTAFEIGLDHARHALTPPAALMVAPREPRSGAGNALRQGWEAGHARYGSHTRPAGATTQQWLSLRLQAWLRDVPFETLSVTPHYLGQLATSHCPVTRRALTAVDPLGPNRPGPNTETDGVIARLRLQDGQAEGYSAGHLATLSRVADLARTELGWDDALAMARRVEAAGGGRLDGLAGDAWRRLGVLLSFVTPLSHAQAARLPLLVLPPNRLHLRNPIQALQVLATRLLTHSGWSRRLPALLALLPQAHQREDFQRFFLALLARTLEAGQPTDPLRRRWALEDAWRDTEVQQLWWAFAWPLSAAQAESLVERAAGRGLLDARLMVHADEVDADDAAPVAVAVAIEPAHAPRDIADGPRHLAAQPRPARPREARGMPIATWAERRRPLPSIATVAVAAQPLPQQLALPWSTSAAAA